MVVSLPGWGVNETDGFTSDALNEVEVGVLHSYWVTPGSKSDDFLEIFPIYRFSSLVHWN